MTEQLTDRAEFPKSPSIYKVAYWSLIPMILVMPIWIALGRAFFGAGGWMFLVTLPLAAVIFFPYHILLVVLAFVNKKRELSEWAMLLLLTYYALAFTFQLSLVDGGDTKESVGSVLTFIGLPELMNTIIFALSFGGGFIVMITLVVVMSMDIARSKKNKPLSSSAK
ncbi:MAG TPA: hypothetical protein VGE34_01270 [Candidatus Saccharimonadales bacterium]